MAKLLILRKCTFVLATFLAAAETPLHAQACPQMEHTLAGAKRARYLQLSSARMNADAPGKVHISHFLESGSWSVVFAKSPASERAVSSSIYKVANLSSPVRGEG